jgi:ribosomal protein L17
MITDLLRHERIETTDTRAKELRRVAEKTITLAKQGTLHARRRAASIVRDKEVLKKLFDEIAKKYKDRPGGYTRIVKLGIRRGE